MRSLTLAEVVGRAIGAALGDLHTCLPGKVVRYDAGKQQADVQPLIKRSVEDESGARQVEALPVVTNVPVAFPRGGGYRLTFPIAVGDVVLLVFAEASLDVWLARGGHVDPRDDRRHTLTDAIAIPGIADFGHPLASVPTDRLSMGRADGPTLEITETEIRAGGGAALATAADLETFKTALENAVVVANDGGESLRTTLLELLDGWPAGTTTLKGA